jgi:hypothetical protein
MHFLNSSQKTSVLKELRELTLVGIFWTNWARMICLLAASLKNTDIATAWQSQTTQVWDYRTASLWKPDQMLQEIHLVY